MKRIGIAVSFFLLLWACKPEATYMPQEGDFVFQSVPQSDLTEAIEGATQSPYSHVGLVLRKNDSWYVREAIGPVTDTPLEEWVERGRYEQAFDAFRLRDEFKLYIPKLIQASGSFLERPYDFRYDLDDETIYCSELLYKSMIIASGIPLGELQRLGDLNWQPYRATIEKYEGGKPPLDRRMITPKSLAEADELEKVYNGYP